MSSEYQRRWSSLMHGYMPPEKPSIDPTLELHTDAVEVEPITYEVLRSRFWSINWDHQETIKRVSGSGVTVYADDFETSIQTEDGEGVVFGPGILFFAGCADLVIKWTLEHRSGNVGIGPGDIFIQDDPWVGTNHQMDTAMYAPVFVDGRLFCWVYNSVHQQEIGGVEPGGFVQQARDTFWEATAFPPIKLIEAGEWREDLLDAWVRRSRLPQLCLLEIKSQVAGVEFARARMEETIEQYGPEVVKGTMRTMIANTEEAVSRRLGSIPDGTWRDARYVSGALPDDLKPYRFELSVTKRGPKLRFSNKGTDPAVGSFNVVPGVMRAAILHAALPLLAYDQFLCGAGVLRCIEFEPELGTITSAEHPSAVSTSLGTACAVNQAQYLLGKMLGAAPDQRGNVVGASSLHTHVYTQMFGVDQNGSPYANFPFDGIGGGSGAFAFRDGIDHGGGLISTRLKIGNVEEWERSIPFLYLYRREVSNGGGHGRWRGGAGIVTAWTGHGSDESFISSGGIIQSVTQGHGLSGGLPGSGGTFWQALDTEIRGRFEEGDLPAGPVELRRLAPQGGPPPPKKFDNRLVEGDLFEVMPQMGAGHGDPLLRDPQLVAEDVRRKRLSRDDARRIYGVRLDGAGTVDAGATDEARQALRSERRASFVRPPLEAHEQANRDAPVIAYALETVAIVAWQGGLHLACAHCHQILDRIDGNYRDGCGLLEVELPSIDEALFLDPRDQVGAEVLLRQYACPGCGLVLDADISPSEVEPYQDVEIHSTAHVQLRAGAEPVAAE